MAKKHKLEEERDLAKMEMVVNEDRIRALPESLIHHILSFLEMKDVVKTSRLSKRWRNIWTSAPVLKFSVHEEPQKAARWITSLLAFYEAPKIEKFMVDFDYTQVDTAIIDSMVHFAVSRDVEVLRMDFQYMYWEMPQCFFASKSLKSLDLTGCVLKFPISFHFRLLKTLRLVFVDFSILDTSGCPLLEDVSLIQCNRTGNLDIHSPNERLKSVYVRDSKVGTESSLSIYAPKLLNVSFHGYMRRNYNIRNLSSIVSAELIFDVMLERSEDVTIDDPATARKLFGDLSHVKDLRLCRWCILVCLH